MDIIHTRVPDEVYQQILKDVARSGGHLEPNPSDKELEKFQDEMTQLICWVLHRHPKLKYVFLTNGVNLTNGNRKFPFVKFTLKNSFTPYLYFNNVFKNVFCTKMYFNQEIYFAQKIFLTHKIISHKIFIRIKNYSTEREKIVRKFKKSYCFQLLPGLQRHSGDGTHSNGPATRLAHSRANISRIPREIYGEDYGEG